MSALDFQDSRYEIGDHTFKRILRQKRKQAAMNNDYMVTVLNTFFQE